jgi:cobyrinic acid a,c-diamide synthase
VIFNNLNAERYNDMSKVAERAGVKPYGFLPHDPDFTIKSRRLGLIPASEIEFIKEKLLRLGEAANKSVDISGLLELSASAGAVLMPPEKLSRVKKSVRIAVANDKAFCFRYIENIEALEEAGAEIIFFSPLHDARLPENIKGLYLCGGYPELYKEELASNTAMLSDIKKAVVAGMPVIAESGGFMILHDTLDGYPMAGAIKGRAYKTENLQRFGYAELTALHDNILCEAGEKIRAHEFHYWDSDNNGDGFSARKPGHDTGHTCVNSTEIMYAGFPQLYFPSNPKLAERFISKAGKFAW